MFFRPASYLNAGHDGVASMKNYDDGMITMTVMIVDDRQAKDSDSRDTLMQ